MHAFNFVYVADISAAFSTSLKSYSHLMKLMHDIHLITDHENVHLLPGSRAAYPPPNIRHTNKHVDTFIVIACGRIQMYFDAVELKGTTDFRAGGSLNDGGR